MQRLLAALVMGAAVIGSTSRGAAPLQPWHDVEAWRVGATTFVSEAGSLFVVMITPEGELRRTDSIAFEARRIAGVARLASPWPAAAVALRGGLEGERLVLLDLRDSLRPELAPGSGVAGAFHALATSGPLLFAARADRPYLEIFLQDSFHLTRIGHWAPTAADGPVQALVTRGEQLYALCWNSVLLTLEVSRTGRGTVTLRETGRLPLRRADNYTDAIEAGSRLLTWIDDTTLVAVDLVRSRSPHPAGAGMLHVIRIPVNGAARSGGGWQAPGANVIRVVPIGPRILLAREDGLMEQVSLSPLAPGLARHPAEQNAPGMPLLAVGRFVIFWRVEGELTARQWTRPGRRVPN